MLAHQLHRVSEVRALARLRQTAAGVRGGRHVCLGLAAAANRRRDATRVADGAAPLLAATCDSRQPRRGSAPHGCAWAHLIRAPRPA
jgi:hypothetical protein